MTTGAPAERFDVVVAGAGHNSLVAAAYLARAGYRCVVLEQQAIVGGGARTAEPTLPGFRHDLFASVHNGLNRHPMWRTDELGLNAYGIEYITPRVPSCTCRSRRRSPHAVARPRQDVRRVRQDLAERRSSVPADWPPNGNPPGPSSARTGSRVTATKPDGGAAPWPCRPGRHRSAPTLRGRSLAGPSFWLPRTWAAPRLANPMTGRAAYAMANQRRSGRPNREGRNGNPDRGAGPPDRIVQRSVLPNKPVARLIVEGGRCRGVECR